MMANGTAYGEILQTSADMLAAAQAGDWEGMTAHAQERSRLLEMLPISDLAVAGTLQILLAHNEQMRGLASVARDNALQALGEHQHRHRALSAYISAGDER